MIDLATVKNELQITYDDPAVDDRICGIMTRAESHVRELIAAEADSELTGTEEQLFLDCCRYIFNGAFEAFDTNLLGTINQCRAKRLAETKQNEADNG